MAPLLERGVCVVLLIVLGRWRDPMAPLEMLPMVELGRVRPLLIVPVRETPVRPVRLSTVETPLRPAIDELLLVRLRLATPLSRLRLSPGRR